MTSLMRTKAQIFYLNAVLLMTSQQHYHYNKSAMSTLNNDVPISWLLEIPLLNKSIASTS